MNDRQANYLYKLELESKKQLQAEENGENYEIPCDFML